MIDGVGYVLGGNTFAKKKNIYNTELVRLLVYSKIKYTCVGILYGIQHRIGLRRDASELWRKKKE